MDAAGEMSYLHSEMRPAPGASDGRSAKQPARSRHTLYTLPPELFLLICSYLDARFLAETLSKVCTKFRDILEDESLWKTRVFKRWAHHFFVAPETGIGWTTTSWKEICINKEEQVCLWSDWTSKMSVYTLHGAHDAVVDKIHIFQDGVLCASGSRDRDLKIWDLRKLHGLRMPSPNASECLSRHIPNAHSGWLWALASDADYLYTGAWDGCVKLWDVANGFAQTAVYNCPCAVLCLATCGNVLCAGTYAQRVYVFDKRDLQQPVRKLAYHRKPVLCLSVDDRFLVTGSEDETVVVYDMVAGKERVVLKLDDYPMCMSYDLNQLWLGDKQGKIYLVDPTRDAFTLIESFDSLHSGRITGILHSHGTLITSSNDKSIRVMEPCSKAKTVALLQLDSEVSGISQHRSSYMLSSSNSDGSINLWIPNEWNVSGLNVDCST